MDPRELAAAVALLYVLGCVWLTRRYAYRPWWLVLGQPSCHAVVWSTLWYLEYTRTPTGLTCPRCLWATLGLHAYVLAFVGRVCHDECARLRTAGADHPHDDGDEDTAADRRVFTTVAGAVPFLYLSWVGVIARCGWSGPSPATVL